MKEFSRREFLRWAGIMGGASLFAGCQFFEHAGPIPKYITGAPSSDPIETTLGVRSINSVCGLCEGNCPITCRIAQGMLVKIGGNPINKSSVHQLQESAGAVTTSAICAIGGSGVQTLYNPYRVAKPLKRVGERGSGKWTAISWEQALNQITQGGNLFPGIQVSGLKDVRSGASALRILAGNPDIGAESFLRYFVGLMGNAELAYEPTLIPGAQKRQIINQIFGNTIGALRVDYKNAAAVISFGDAPLDSGTPLTLIARQIADARINRSMKWAVVDPRLSVSGSKADLWVPVKPGKDLELALGIMRSLMDRNLAANEPDSEIKAKVSAKIVDQHALDCGLNPSIISELADIAAAGGTKTAVFPGPGIYSQANGAQTAAAILSINKMVGAAPGTGGLIAQPLGNFRDVPAPTQSGGQAQNNQQISGPAITLTWRTDPVYDKQWVADVLSDTKQVPLFIAINCHITETSALADYILPDTTYLERFDIASAPEMGWVGLRRPVVGAVNEAGNYFPILPETKIMEDILIALGSQTGLPEFDPKKPDSPKNAYEYYQRRVAAVMKSVKNDQSIGFETNIQEIFDRGGFFSNFQTAKPPVNPAPKTYWPTAPENTSGAALDDELCLITYYQPFHRDPSAGINTWLLEIKPENRLAINPLDAAKHGLKQGDLVKVENRAIKKSVITEAHVLPGIRPGVLALAKGYGYKQAGASPQTIGGTNFGGDKVIGAGINTAELTGGLGSAWVTISKA